MFHNWPDRSRKRLPPIPKHCSLSMQELHERLVELHGERRRLLVIARQRDLTSGEIRLAKHILREIDWYEIHEAAPGLLALDAQVTALERKVKKLVKAGTNG